MLQIMHYAETIVYIYNYWIFAWFYIEWLLSFTATSIFLSTLLSHSKIYTFHKH